MNLHQNYALLGPMPPGGGPRLDRQARIQFEWVHFGDHEKPTRNYEKPTWNHEKQWKPTKNHKKP